MSYRTIKETEQIWGYLQWEVELSDPGGAFQDNLGLTGSKTPVQIG